MHLILYSYHVTYAFQSEYELYSCLNFKELVARKRHNIWSLSDWNWTQTHNHIVCKRILNHLAKLAKWLSSIMSTYLYGAFNFMFLSCHVHRGVVVITTAKLDSSKPELEFCAGSNPARGMSEIRDGDDLWQWSCLEIRLNAFRRSTIPQKQFIVAWTSRNSFLETGTISEV